ncbi:hypothetical protein H2203_005475 [Taxawa tesnikishii (nom. ined.)]|nr:hypothetical protein H2203_005475 [Dothideales sp. JES 119]
MAGDGSSVVSTGSKTSKHPRNRKRARSPTGPRGFKIYDLLHAPLTPHQKLAKTNPGVLSRMTTFTRDRCSQLLDLPKELQLRVFELVVVRPDSFIWPDTKTGQEQPDLAMVNKQLRKEVLPLFYGKNTFGFDATAWNTAHTVAKWGAAIGQENFRHTRKLAIFWEQSILWTGNVKKINWCRAILSTAKYWEAVPKGQDRDRFLVCIGFDAAAKRWKVDVHRDATCIIEGPKCNVTSAPTTYAAKVVSIISPGGGRGSLRPEGVRDIVTTTNQLADDLIEARCAAK